MRNTLLEGNWEVSYLGMRIEVHKNDIIFLWRYSPVLQTEFLLEQTQDKIQVILKNNEFRYSPSSSPYCTVQELYLKDDRLILIQNFPITGLSTETLKKTDRSRYGDYTIVDQVLDELQGQWKDTQRDFCITFKNDILDINGEKVKIHVLKNNKDNSNALKIADAEPARLELPFALMPLEYYGDRIVAKMMVCDADPIIFNCYKITT